MNGDKQRYDLINKQKPGFGRSGRPENPCSSLFISGEPNFPVPARTGKTLSYRTSLWIQDAWLPMKIVSTLLIVDFKSESGLCARKIIVRYGDEDVKEF